MKKLTILASLCVLLYSCYPTHPCQDSVLIPAFTGFSNPDDFTTIIFRAYKQGDHFSEIKDSLLINNPSNGIPSPGGDTVYIWLNGAFTSKNHYWVMGPDFDWEVYLPALNRTYRISEIVNRRTEGKGRYCLNEITSCSVDGKTINPVYTGDKIGEPTGFVLNLQNE